MAALPFHLNREGVMKILAYVHFYPPYHFAGSEIMLHNILRHMQARGHEVKVICTAEPTAPLTWEFEGITCERTSVNYTGCKALSRFHPDITITHHQETVSAFHYSRNRNIKVVQLIHNDHDAAYNFLDLGADLVVYNTAWVRDKLSVKYTLPSTVLHPPVHANEHNTLTTGNKVTLINLNEHKGSSIFYELAERMPDVEFLAVEGGHGYQVFEPHHNVTHQSQTTNMRDDVWAKTKILLVPSIYESYGMVGVEALASGIPVLATPTPGLKESLSYAGTFIGRDDITAWECHIRRLLDNSSAYDEMSKLAFKRSAELDPATELDELAYRLERLVV